MRSKLLAGLTVGLVAAVGSYAHADEKDTDVKQYDVDVQKDAKPGQKVDVEKGYQRVLGDIREQTGSREIISMLDGFENKLDHLEDVANKQEKDLRNDLKNDIKKMREKAFDTKERARKMADPGVDSRKMTELRDDIRNAFEDLNKDYVKTTERLHEKERGGLFD
ncbi:MAG: hypothetical protein AB2A00_17580 [Myxococcota bacterium]